MSNSKLVDYVKISKNKNSPRKYPITKITVHHMAGALSVEQCGEIFSGGRQVSSNYGIGTDGRVGMYVEESDRSWCSSNSDNDHRAVTIECANDGGEPDWHVSDTVFNKLIDLCVDICIRNGIERLNYTGDKTGNLTMHSYFTPTVCPGPYLKSRFKDIERLVNERLAKMTVGTPVKRNTIVDQFEVTINNLNGRKAPNTNSDTKWGKYITPGFYNVLDTTKDAKYTWYMIEKNIDGTGENLWASDIGGTFYEKECPPVEDWESKYYALKEDFDKLLDKLNSIKKVVD